MNENKITGITVEIGDKDKPKYRRDITVDLQNNEQSKRKITDRFIFCYSPFKKKFLIENKIFPLFESINKKSNSPYWVFDATVEARDLFGEYDKIREMATNSTK